MAEGLDNMKLRVANVCQVGLGCCCFSIIGQCELVLLGNTRMITYHENVRIFLAVHYAAVQELLSFLGHLLQHLCFFKCHTLETKSC